MEGVMIGGSYPVTQRRSGTQGMNSRFRRNTLLANTALILLRYIWRVLVDPSSVRELLRRQAHRHRIPEVVLALPLTLALPKTHKRTATKYEFGEIKRNIKALSQRSERGPCTRSSLNSRELGEEC
jgi:hypothetical protein